MSDPINGSLPTALHLELESIVDRLVSILGCANATRVHVLENLVPDRELLRHIDGTCLAVRDALVAVTHLQLANRDWMKSAFLEVCAADAEQRSRSTLRLPSSRR